MHHEHKALNVTMHGLTNAQFWWQRIIKRSNNVYGFLFKLLHFEITSNVAQNLLPWSAWHLIKKKDAQQLKRIHQELKISCPNNTTCKNSKWYKITISNKKNIDPFELAVCEIFNHGDVLMQVAEENIHAGRFYKWTFS